MEQELQSLVENLQGLKQAAGRFGHSKEALSVLKDESEGLEILVPLSLFFS